MDEMMKAWEKFSAENGPDGGGCSPLTLFQHGWSGGAVSMRARAQKIVQELAEAKTVSKTKLNDAVNAVGQLPDIAPGE